MKRVDPANLRSVREAIGLSQAELAELLGTSERAVQSYEQKWRPTPAHIQKSAGLLLFLNWRKDHPKAQPCWEIRGCSVKVRAACNVHRFRAGDVCWLITGCRCARAAKTWEAKVSVCRKCRVMRQWLDAR